MKPRLLTCSLLICLGLSACQQQDVSQTANKSTESDDIEANIGANNADSLTEHLSEPDHNNLHNEAAANQFIESIGFAETATDTDGILPDTERTSDYQAACNTFVTDTKVTATSRNNAANSEKQQAFCGKISKRLASVSNQSCLAAQLRPTGCTSVNGVPLMLTEFPPLEGKTPLGRVLVIGGTHGDELTSVSVTFRWIEKLNKFHSGLFHWHIIPAMNPDGLLRRAATRTNHNGVDLNRNMPSEDWGQNAISYWESKTSKDPRKFPGDRPNSEPETQWLVDEINLFQPDAIIAIHAPYGVVDFDALQLNTAPKSLGKLHLNLLGTYPGSLGNYAGINRNIPVITLELPHSWVMPSEKESDLIWQDIVSWLKKNLSTENAASPAE